MSMLSEPPCFVSDTNTERLIQFAFSMLTQIKETQCFLCCYSDGILAFNDTILSVLEVLIAMNTLPEPNLVLTLSLHQ